MRAIDRKSPVNAAPKRQVKKDIPKTEEELEEEKGEFEKESPYRNESPYDEDEALENFDDEDLEGDINDDDPESFDHEKDEDDY